MIKFIGKIIGCIDNLIDNGIYLYIKHFDRTEYKKFIGKKEAKK